MSVVVAVVGPTATGKSDLAIALARALGGEVVNADSMQLYRGMDVGTAKLGAGEWGGVAHHVFDIWDVTETASVVEYQRAARSAIDGLIAAGKVPVLAGGSGLYVRAVLDTMEFPGTDPAARAVLEGELAEHGPAVLHERLARIDPDAAAAILASNGRRIVRALEVVGLTGRPFAASLPDPVPHYPSVQIGLDRDPVELDARCDLRAARMWSAGLLAEVRMLDAQGLRQGATASRALGYAQALAQLDGQLSEAEAIAHTQQATRRFVRRQRSWFRRDARIQWLDASAAGLEANALAEVRKSAGATDSWR